MFNYVDIEPNVYKPIYEDSYSHIILKVMQRDNEINITIAGLSNAKSIDSVMRNKFTMGPNKRVWSWSTDGSNRYRLTVYKKKQKSQ